MKTQTKKVSKKIFRIICIDSYLIDLIKKLEQNIEKEIYN